MANTLHVKVKYIQRAIFKWQTIFYQYTLWLKNGRLLLLGETITCFITLDFKNIEVLQIPYNSFTLFPKIVNNYPFGVLYFPGPDLLSHVS
jgi:hypothetical protein